MMDNSRPISAKSTIIPKLSKPIFSKTDRPYSAVTNSEVRAKFNELGSICSTHSCPANWLNQSSYRPATATYTPRSWRETSFQLYSARQHAWIEIYGLNEAILNEREEAINFFGDIYKGCAIIEWEVIKPGNLYIKYSEKDARKVFQEYKRSAGKRISYKNAIWKMKPVDRDLMSSNPYVSPKGTTYTLKICGLEKNLSEYRLITEICNPNEGIAGGYEKINYNRSRCVATVTYKKMEDAECAYQLFLEKKLPSLGKEVSAEKMFSKCTPTSSLIETEKCFLLRGLSKGITPTDIEEYLRMADKGCRIHEVQFGMSVDTALVFFDQIADYTKVYKYTCKVPLKQEMIEVEHVYKSQALEVHCPESISYSDIRKFLHKKKFINENCHCLSKYDGCIIVVFPSAKAAENILEQGTKYGLHGETITIKFHHECIGIMPPEHNYKHQASLLSSGKDFRVQEDVFLFMLNNSEHFKALEIQMDDIETDIKIDSNRSVLTSISRIPSETKNYPFKMLAWEREVTTVLNLFLSQFDHEVIQMTEKAKMSKSLDRKIQEQTGECIIKMKHGSIHITGKKEHFRAVMTNVKKLLEKEEKLVTEKLTDFNKLQFKLLMKTELTEGLENKLDVEIVTPKVKDPAVIVIKGLDADVKKAVGIIKKKVEDMGEETITFSPVVKVLKTEIQRNIKQICQGEMVVCKYDDEFTLVSSSKRESEQIKNSIQSTFSEGIIQIPRRSSRVARETSKHWQKFKEQLQTTYGQSMVWHLDLKYSTGNIIFAATSKDPSVLETLEGKVSGFLQDNMDVTWFIPLPETVASCSKQWMAEKMLKQASKENIFLTFATEVPGIILCGNSLQIEQLKTKIMTLVQRIEFKKLKVTGPGLPKYFTSAEGKGILERYIRQLQVHVEIETTLNYRYVHDKTYQAKLIPPDMVKYKRIQTSRSNIGSRFSMSANSMQSCITVDDDSNISQNRDEPRHYENNMHDVENVQVDNEYLQETFSNHNQNVSELSGSQSVIHIGPLYVIITHTNDFLTEHLQMNALSMADRARYEQCSATTFDFNVRQSNELSWRKCVNDLLQAACRGNVTALSLPFIETDRVLRVDKMASVVAECLNDMISISDNETNLKEIRIRAESENARMELASILNKSAKGDTVIFHLFGTKEEDIDQVYKDIEEKCASECKKLVLEQGTYGAFVSHLSEEQREKIMKFQEEHPVEIDIDDHQGITIQGLIADRNAAKSLIDEMRSQYENKVTQQLREIAAKIISDLVQWYIVENVDRPLSIQDSFAVEEQYKIFNENKENKEKFEANIHTDDGKVATVNFKKETYIVDKKSDKIKRKTFVEHQDEPTNWERNVQGFQAVVDRTTEEFREIRSRFLTSVQTNRTVEQIFRIQNPLLHNRFEVRKKEMKKNNQDVDPKGQRIEKLLWHGTSSEAVTEINATRFNRAFAGKNATAYGKGVYFAVNAAYSDRDTYSRKDTQGFKLMYLCRVLTGEYTVGNDDMIVPPKRKEKFWFFGENKSYDTVVDNMKSPQMHVCFYDDQACPQYLIKYK